MNFHPLSLALLGGSLIGLAATLMLLGTGRIAGISGISKGLIPYKQGDFAWRFAFVAGLVVGGALLYQVRPEAFQIEVSRPLWMIAVAGLLVGFGSVLSNGCTSGHGVCGVSRLSPRSIVATFLFIASGMVTVSVLGAVAP